MHDLNIRGYGRLHIGGQERPLHWGTYQARTYCELAGIELDAYQQAVADLFSQGGLTATVALSGLVYSALRAGSRRDGQEPDFTPDDVLFWVDEADAAELGKAFAVLAALAPPPADVPGKPAGPKPRATKS
ncbi:hypothetical protein [Hymenobacter psychrophilus]|uniref:Phage tail tube protein, GTA-gp10 n=1 Tax=Hymenobacter psychrophilus TaxID=651662 RepID=A0A1H3P8W1_9BACT|nr:hypothetical protein [Hymenobacter psychrophilus]SDY97527.1 hypothetical protein SAMN04488069_1255 [Hymenobacter psychrophilus]